MQKKHWLLLILGAVLLSSLVVTFRSVGAEEQPPFSPEQLVLREEDFPEGTIMVGDRERITDEPGPQFTVGVPFQSEGFLVAYRTEAVYFSDLKNGQSAADYVISIAYRFENSAQAKAAFQRQLELHTTRYVRPGYFERDIIDLDIPVIARKQDTSFTKVIRDRYSLDNDDNQVPLHEGMDLETYYLYNVEGDTVMLLMVDAFHAPDPVSRQILEDLATKMLQRRK